MTSRRVSIVRNSAASSDSRLRRTWRVLNRATAARSSTSRRNDVRPLARNPATDQVQALLQTQEDKYGTDPVTLLSMVILRNRIPTDIDTDVTMLSVFELEEWLAEYREGHTG